MNKGDYFIHMETKDRYYVTGIMTPAEGAFVTLQLKLEQRGGHICTCMHCGKTSLDIDYTKP
jgi:hypothetical protein